MNTASPAVDCPIHRVVRASADERQSQAHQQPLARAEELLASGLVAAASEIYDTILEHEEVPAARHGAARCAFLRSELHAALGHLQRLEREGATAELANDLGVIYFHLGLAAEARQQLELAVELAPDHEAAWQNLVDITAAAGDQEASRACQARLAALAP